MTAERPVQIAILGAGTIGTIHGLASLETDAVRVRSVWSRAPASAERLAERLGARAVADAAEIAADPEVDAVLVATPTHLHAEGALAAIAAGKHVLCEKPLARDLASAERIVSAANAAGVYLLVGHVVRFFPEFVRLREAIRDGALRGEGLRRELLRLAPPPEGKDDQGGYDALDALIAGVLLDEPPPPTVRPELRGWDPEMVPYQPTPARIVLELAGHVRRGDVFYDLGAGLGQVCVLVHLLAGARAVGVEVDPALWAYAQRLARGLRLAGVTFAVGDARQADLSPGTFFFLYTPFTGALLDAVLARLRGVAASHRIRVASYGPCTPTVARQAWLVPEGPAHEDPEQLAVFQSASGGAPGSRRSATPDRARPKRPTHRRALYPRYSFSLAVSASVSLTQST